MTVTGRRLLIAGALTLIALSAAPSSAFALRGLRIGISSDDALTLFTPAVRDTWDTRAYDDGIRMIRVAIRWSDVAPATRPSGFDPSNPASPGYDWSLADAAVRSAAAHGLDVLMMFYSAPLWAEGPNKPSDLVREGVWDPNIGQYASFATAIARRYSGTFPDPLHPGQSLPRVRYWQGWNEPNLGYYLSPQWTKTSGGKFEPAAPALYRRMENAFYDRVKAVNRSNFIVLAGTGPFGDPPGNFRMEVLPWYRYLLCLDRNPGCPGKVDFDAVDHHPLDIPGPTYHAASPQNITTPDIWKISRLVRQGVKAGHVLPRGSKQTWVDEIAWDSNPPSPQKKVAVSLSTQARWVEQAEYMLWRQGVSTMMWLQLRDYTTSNYTFSWSGMYFNDGTPKPSLTALRFPLVAQRLSRGRVRVWGRSPAAGALSVSAGGKMIKRLNVKALDVFQFNVGLRGRAVLKASVAGQSSLPWTQS
jgi:hypothetical protein